MGERGFRAVGEHCFNKAHFLASALQRIPGISLRFEGEFFNEFVVSLPEEPDGLLEFLKKNSVLGGIPLKKYYPSMKNELLISVTEIHSRESLENFAHLVEEWARRVK